MMAKTFDRQTAKFLAVVGENMPEISGDVMQGWIENPKSIQRVLKIAFCPPEATPDFPEFKVWKTIKLGTGFRNADDFRKALESGGYRIGDWANDILGKPAFKVAAEKIEVDLVKVTVAELGFKDGARRDQIYERAKEIGLELCPDEVGPQLRLQYRDQPNNEWILVGMESIFDSGGGLAVFGVGRRGSGLWLRGYWSNPDSFWGAGYRWVFVRPRNSLHLPVRSGTGFILEQSEKTKFLLWQGFYFRILIQPPSILPISSSFSESKIYFLLSNDFISHATCKKNFNKSNFKEAPLSEINFSVLSE